MTRYDSWKTQTPEDDQDERDEEAAREAARIERMIDAAEDE